MIRTNKRTPNAPKPTPMSREPGVVSSIIFFSASTEIKFRIFEIFGLSFGLGWGESWL